MLILVDALDLTDWRRNASRSSEELEVVVPAGADSSLRFSKARTHVSHRLAVSVAEDDWLAGPELLPLVEVDHESVLVSDVDASDAEVGSSDETERSWEIWVGSPPGDFISELFCVDGFVEDVVDDLVLAVEVLGVSLAERLPLSLRFVGDGDVSVFVLRIAESSSCVIDCDLSLGDEFAKVLNISSS